MFRLNRQVTENKRRLAVSTSGTTVDTIDREAGDRGTSAASSASGKVNVWFYICDAGFQKV